MPMTTAHEVRQDAETGKYYLWSVTTSDIPGEGGAVRGDEVTLVSLTAHELGVRERMEAHAVEGVELEAKLTAVIGYKAAIEGGSAPIDTPPE